MNWKALPWFILDTETTSKHANDARVTQIGTMIHPKRGNRWINPGIEVPKDVVEAIHLTPEELKQIRQAKPFSEETAPQLHQAILARGFVVGYNIINYDRIVLDNEFKRVGLRFPDVPLIDVLVLCRALLWNATPEDLPDFKLTSIAKYLHLPTEGAHRAAQDCLMTHAVLDYIKHNLPPSMADLQAIQAEQAEYGSFWACTPEGLRLLNTKSAKHRRGMTPAEAWKADPSYFEWMRSKCGPNARKALADEQLKTGEVPF